MNVILEGILMGLAIFAVILTSHVLLKYRGTAIGKLLQTLELFFKYFKK